MSPIAMKVSGQSKEVMDKSNVGLNDLERLTPDLIEEDDFFNREALRLHLDRYGFAKEHLTGSRILDCACGVGYGTKILSADQPNERCVTGMDISEEAIQYAQKRYHGHNIDFIAADGATFRSEHEFDTIVTLETIEHLPDPVAFIANLVSLVADNGRIIASVPITPSVDGNPYHLHDFTNKSFHRLFTKHGFEMTCEMKQIQKFSLFGVMSGKSSQREGDIRDNLTSYYLRHPQSFIRRLLSIARYGITNRYATAVWELNRSDVL